MPPQNQTRGNNSGLRLFPVGGFTGQGSTWGPSRAQPSRWGACPGARACAVPRPGAGPAPCSAEPARLCPSCPPGKLHAPQRASPPRLPLRGGGDVASAQQHHPARGARIRQTLATQRNTTARPGEGTAPTLSARGAGARERAGRCRDTRRQRRAAGVRGASKAAGAVPL